MKKLLMLTTMMVSLLFLSACQPSADLGGVDESEEGVMEEALKEGEDTLSDTDELAMEADEEQADNSTSETSTSTSASMPEAETASDSASDPVAEEAVAGSTSELTPAPTSETEAVPAPAVKSFTMTAKNWEFTPSTITVNEGDTVQLSITSVDVDHGFALPQFGVSVNLVPRKTVQVEFVASKKGTFSFFCNVACGSGHGSMKGSLVVK